MEQLPGPDDPSLMMDTIETLGHSEGSLQSKTLRRLKKKSKYSDEYAGQRLEIWDAMKLELCELERQKQKPSGNNIEADLETISISPIPTDVTTRINGPNTIICKAQIHEDLMKKNGEFLNNTLMSSPTTKCKYGETDSDSSSPSSSTECHNADVFANCKGNAKRRSNFPFRRSRLNNQRCTRGMKRKERSSSSSTKSPPQFHRSRSRLRRVPSSLPRRRVRSESFKRSLNSDTSDNPKSNSTLSPSTEDSCTD